MGFGIKIVFVLLAVTAAVVYQSYRNLSREYPAPELDVNEYWGPGPKASYKEDPSIKPFTLNYGEAVAELKQQLARPLKLHAPLEDVGFEYGFNSEALEKVIAYWRDNYLTRWSEREQFLNKFPQYTTQIQGLNIHYLHVKPSNPGAKKVLPLLLLHGWPGSVREFYELIPLLTTPNKKSDYVFEVIAPSLPGYCWSQAASKKGLGQAQAAVILRNLMLRVGHSKFLIQGGDWGSVVGRHIAKLFPANTIGHHSNSCINTSGLSIIKQIIASNFPSFFIEKEHEEFFLPGLNVLSFLLEEFGYSNIQMTKPDTIGIALTGNPVGLAAYILEKFPAWTDFSFRQLKDGGLDKKLSMDALLDNLMIYYLSNSITTSQRFYAEWLGNVKLNLEQVPTNVPIGCARFRYDLAHNTDWQLKDMFKNIVTSTYYPDGGHFVALELPNVLYDDFVAYVGKVFPS